MEKSTLIQKVKSLCMRRAASGLIEKTVFGEGDFGVSLGKTVFGEGNFDASIGKTVFGEGVFEALIEN